MAKSKKRFAFTSKSDLEVGSRAQDVGKLQALLASLGYLRGSYDPGTFCHCTERAVRRYQRFFGLETDGVVGPKTRAHLEQPRCGVPDIPTVPGDASAPFVLRGCKYNRNHLTFAFLNGTSDLPGQREREIVRQAFDAWAGVADLQFTEVGANDGPDLRVAWRSGDHGDGSSFDGPGNTLAHGFFPPPCGGANSGDLHFDEDELWIDGPGNNGFVLLQVAIHEIGHLLGLSHSQDPTAIMFPTYSPDRANLAQDDIDGIRALYGVRTGREPLVLTAEAAGTLQRGGDEKVYSFDVPQRVAISLAGPADADFDLYVKKDQPPTDSDFDFRAFSASANEKILLPIEPGGKYFVRVVSFSGSGAYTLKVEPSP